jgi:hypothetical protein
VTDVLWPEPCAPQRSAGLWRHTCFEAFCAVPRASAYYEFNFSPSTAWAAYRFGGYREQLAEPELAVPPTIQLRRGERAVLLDVTLDIAGLPRLAPTAPLDVALGAVLESHGGGIHYFALAHPAERADFHDRRGFLLTLAGYGAPAT